MIPAIVKTSALSRFGATVTTEAPAEWELPRGGGGVGSITTGVVLQGSGVGRGSAGDIGGLKTSVISQTTQSGLWPDTPILNMCSPGTNDSLVL